MPIIDFFVENWVLLIFAFLGACLPAAANAVVAAFQYARVRFNPSKHPATALLGKWSVYHYSRRDGRPILRAETWQMRLNWRGSIAVRTTDPQMKNLIYAGELNGLASAHLTCRMHGCQHSEEFYVRILYPIPSDEEATFGIKVGENFDHDVFSTLYLFSRRPLSPQVSSRRLRDKLRHSLSPELHGILLRSGTSSKADTRTQGSTGMAK